MGIDIYIMRDGALAEDDKPQTLNINQGHVGYLREAYHGGPYATELLVKEAFEAKDGKAQIPIDVLRKRLTEKQDATAATRVREAEVITLALEKVIERRNAKMKRKAADGEEISGSSDNDSIVENALSSILPSDIQEAVAKLTERSNMLPKQLSVVEAVVLRNKLLYNHSNEELQENVQSFIDFVNLAEEREKEQGHPCTIYASH